MFVYKVFVVNTESRLHFGAQWNVNVVSSGCGLCGLHGGGGESDWLFYARLTMKF